MLGARKQFQIDMCLAQGVAVAWLVVVVILLAWNFHTYRSWYHARTGRDLAAMTPRSLTLLFRERHENARVEGLRRKALKMLVSWLITMVGGAGLIFLLVLLKPCVPRL